MKIDINTTLESLENQLDNLEFLVEQQKERLDLILLEYRQIKMVISLEDQPL